MGNVFEKVNGNTIRLIKTVSTPVVTTTEYKLKFLKQQKLTILAQKKRDNDLRDAELLEVQTLIDQCKLLKIEEEIKPV
jgi:hypothetical protein